VIALIGNPNLLLITLMEDDPEVFMSVILRLSTVRFVFFLIMAMGLMIGFSLSLAKLGVFKETLRW